MSDERVTADLRRQGQQAGRRLVVGWRPDGRTVVTAGPDTLVVMVEVGVWARAVQLLERSPGGEAAVEVVRRAMLAQADRLPDAPPPVPPRPASSEGCGGIDWSQ
ncbi:hypothetical protein ACFV6B_12985 [Streptomyces microflavus]|uniref:hypothetical protein n=1 Tax=Streptomyces microflavus TaxID=1919 RepID=UPI0036620F3F